ncbi:PaaI family thioesterase [Rhodococcus rhodnii]|uniref:Uncharacterized protein n=2 Tax=Rhodococcus rhodnii TaxID=38312 RepID=R7WQ90_9NOCA|nr:PaaI family thioesterase [Rhodococcus rhodnii]EOM77486.1 hypothetical protein Rrhod_1163 [Rhodococcus rhodnii LMG 5362]TXG90357.1 PaaI family thioesterase [Rhodococcus rhodnii]
MTAHPTANGSRDGTVLTSPPADAPIDRATAQARRLVEALLRTDRTRGDLAAVADELGRIADQLEAHAPDVSDRLIDMWQGEGVTRHDPVTGPENVLAPPLVIHGRADGSVDATVTLGLPYQGPPGHVHGGVSALLLDHVLGVANAWAGHSGMTAQLSVRYRRPTPLFESLTVRARVEEVDGRKIRTTGEITTANGDACVTVDALFVTAMLPRPR